MIRTIINKIKTFFKKPEIENNQAVKKNTKTRQIRQTYKYQKFRKEIRKIIPQKCWNCDSQDMLQIHHIVSIEDNPLLATEPANTVMLCAPCHTQFHKDCQEAQEKTKLPKEPKPLTSKKSMNKSITELSQQRKLLRTQLKQIETELARKEFLLARELEAGGNYKKAQKSYSRAVTFADCPEYREALKNIYRLMTEISDEKTSLV